MTPKEICDRFFNSNEKLVEEVKLTKEEVTIFERFEWEVLVMNGLKNINGGYAFVTIYDTDEDEEGHQFLLCEVECGEQDTGNGSQCNRKWTLNYNRKTQQFEND